MRKKGGKYYENYLFKAMMENWQNYWGYRGTSNETSSSPF